MGIAMSPKQKFNLGMVSVPAIAIAVVGTVLYGALHKSARVHAVETAGGPADGCRGCHACLRHGVYQART